MGAVFQRTYKAKDGTIKTCDTWTIRYFRAGRAYQEATACQTKTEAIKVLRRREGKIADGVPVTSNGARYRVEDAAKSVVTDYTVNGQRSVADLERRLDLHLLPYFRGRRMADLTPSDIRAYIAHRLSEGASNATVNRELAALKRMFSLAMDDEILTHKPKIPMLTEDNVRAGFVDDLQLEAICRHLEPAVQAVVRFAYQTGWRVQSEVLPIEWRHVDRAAGEVRLDPGATKNRAGRVFLFTDALRALFGRLWAEHEALRAKGTICPHVFQRHGKRIKSIREAWARACVKAGCPGRIPHDLRRSAVRTMEQRGLSRSVAMALTGHKTEAVYRRYAITSTADLQEGVRRLNGDSFRDSGPQIGPRRRARSR